LAEFVVTRILKLALGANQHSIAGVRDQQLEVREERSKEEARQKGAKVSSLTPNSSSSVPSTMS